MTKKCVICKLEYDFEKFFSKTLCGMTEKCNRCRSNEYKKQRKEKKGKQTRKEKQEQHKKYKQKEQLKKFTISKNYSYSFNIDITRIILEYLDNYTKFQVYILYGNIFDLRCDCYNIALYCTTSLSVIRCDYCHDYLHQKYQWFDLFCDKCITDDVFDNFFLEDKGECLCNGCRQMYEIELKTIMFTN